MTSNRPWRQSIFRSAEPNSVYRAKFWRSWFTLLLTTNFIKFASAEETLEDADCHEVHEVLGSYVPDRN